MLSIIVISRSDDNLSGLIESISKSKIDCELEVLVAWNAKSEPPSALAAYEKVPTYFYQIMPYNFARNNNKLSKYASGDYILFLNDDIILDENCLNSAISEIRKPEIGIVGANLRYADNMIQHAGVLFNENYIPFHRMKHSVHYQHPEVLNDEFVPAVTGAFMLMRRSEFNAILFDERFDVAGEDIALCLEYRKKYKRGILYCADATAVHLENATRKTTDERGTPPGDLSLIAEAAKGDVAGTPLTVVKRPSVRIVTEKPGWIMHRKALEIQENMGAENVKINEDWPDASIQYYINYGYFNKRPSKGVVVANFTHFDPDSLADKFVNTAFEVDHCTSVSRLTSDRLREIGIPDSRITDIIVGADVSFRPKITFGIAGRPYKGGRKGEFLLDEVKKDEFLMNNIRIVSRNADWGVETLDIKDSSDFYRMIDFLLITSTIEGGPVPFMEALACGTLAVAPSIGVIPQFPHVPYEAGSVNSLKQAMHKLILDMSATKGRLASSMFRFNWKGWSVRHEKLFRRLLLSSPLS